MIYKKKSVRNQYVLKLWVMVLAHFHDVDGDLSDHNVGKRFGLSKILTVIL